MGFGLRLSALMWCIYAFHCALAPTKPGVESPGRVGTGDASCLSWGGKGLGCPQGYVKGGIILLWWTRGRRIWALPLNFRNPLAFHPMYLFPSVPREEKMLWHSRAVVLHLCAWQCDASASGKSDLRCLKWAARRRGNNQEHWCYRELKLVGRGLTPLLGGSTVLSLKRRERLLELLFFVVRREKYK